MTTKSLEDIYGGEGSEAVVVPASVYDVTVADARGILAKEGKSGIGNIFVDLEVLNGPSAGSLVEVLIFVPDPSNRNALFHFSNKTAAFSSAIKANIAAAGASTAEAILEAITSAMKGKQAKAEIGVVKDGQYAGKNELLKTSIAEGTPVAEAIQVAAVAPAAVQAVTPEPAAAAVGEPDLPF
jgi:hypothetical protein